MVADMQEGQRLRREPEGTKSCRMQGESVRPSVLQSLPFLPPALQRLTQASQRMAQASQRLALACELRRTDGRTGRLTGGRTDGQTDSPGILQDFVPSGSLRGRCPAYLTATITKYQSRSRVPMTISCLRATGFFLWLFFPSSFASLRR